MAAFRSRARVAGVAAILSLGACDVAQRPLNDDPALVRAGCFALVWPTADARIAPWRPDTVRLDTARAEQGMLRDQLDRRLSSVHDTSVVGQRDPGNSRSWSRHLYLRAWKPVAPDSVILAMGNNWTWWLFRLRAVGDTLIGTAGFQSDNGADSTDSRVTAHRIPCPVLKVSVRSPST